jgi:serine/threonine protein kinase
MAASDTEIPSFSITEKLNESQSFIIYHAIRLKTGEPVILKVLKPQAAAERDENFRFRHEFDITSKINLPGIVKATVLEKYNDSLVMVMCDIGGKSLDCFQLPLPIRQFLEISIAPSQML